MSSFPSASPETSPGQDERSSRPLKSRWRRLFRRYPLLRPVLLAGGIAALVFAAFEGVEWIWMSDIDSGNRHQFHRLREIVVAIVAAFVAGRLVIRNTPRPLASSAYDVDETALRSSVNARQLQTYARWFILMRWIAVVVAAILVFITVQVAHFLSNEVWFPLMGTIFGLAVLNLVYTALLSGRSGSARHLLFQAYADLIVLSLLLHFSGGIENPLALLTIFHVIIAGIILSRRQCYLIAGTAALLVALVAGAELAGWVEHYTLHVFPHVEAQGGVVHAAHAGLFVASYVALLGCILLLTAVFVTSLTGRLRRDERQLELMAEKALTQQQILEQALETTGSGLCICDRDLNPVLEKGGLNHTSRGNDRQELPWPLTGAEEPARATLEDGRVHVTELPDEHDKRTFQITTAPLRDKSGSISHVVQLVQDITEQKNVQSRMVRAGKLAAVGELAGQVAHEVNNPIAIISAKARLLLADSRDNLTTKTVTELEKIISLSDRVAHIAQGLLSYCRPSTARRSLVDLTNPVRSALSMIEQRARKSGIEVTDDLPDTLPYIEANDGEVEQIFLNLFLNSLDAMPDGGCLDVYASTEDSELEVTVSDTGSGIPESVRDRIFEPFFTTKPEGKGTGLGLSICHGLMNSFGGHLDVSSERGIGTQISVRFPLATEEQNINGRINGANESKRG